MKTEKVSFSDYGIFICTKCQKSIPANEISPNTTESALDIAEHLKTKYKAALNELGYKGKVRVMSSSCLGVCPKGFQAISQISMKDPSESLSYVFDPHTEQDAILNTIKKSLPKLT
jgi:predicted metal-binding protein